MARLPEHIRPSIIAITDDQQSYAYPAEVILEIREAEADVYVTAARILNEGHFDVVSLQHEFGIFGGPDGAFVLTLLEHLRVPIVTTCHPILADPTLSQRRVLQKVAACSSRIVVMADKGRTLLTEIYGVAAPKIDVIPAVLKQNPETLYLVLGATHPTLLRQQGEAYRGSLRQRRKSWRLLDKDDPSVILSRTVEPLLQPDQSASRSVASEVSFDLRLCGCTCCADHVHARRM